MNRKSFIKLSGATCSNWTWSWSFVNHRDRVVIFGAWDDSEQPKNKAKPKSYLILDASWEFGGGRKKPGYSQAMDHIALIREEGYALMTFKMYHSDKHKDESGQGPAKIRDFDEDLIFRTLKRVGQQYFAVEISARAYPQSDDTEDDLSGADYSGIGADDSRRVQTQKSNVKRDPRVRRMVIARARNGCERSSCSDSRVFAGFLDVHHILGVEKSDRPWTCVALCPNCHREAHFSPDHKKINKEFLTYASQFQ